MRYLVFLFAIFAFLPAQAQETSPNGLSYTTLGARKERTDGHMNYKVLNYDQEQKKKAYRPLDGEEEKPTEEEEQATKVWDKYKALAAGQYKDEQKITPHSHAKTAETEPSAEPQAPATGFAGIMQQYQQNKVQRSQMRVIHVTPPEEEKKEETDEDKQKPAR